MPAAAAPRATSNWSLPSGRSRSGTPAQAARVTVPLPACETTAATARQQRAVRHEPHDANVLRQRWKRAGGGDRQDDVEILAVGRLADLADKLSVRRAYGRDRGQYRRPLAAQPLDPLRQRHLERRFPDRGTYTNGVRRQAALRLDQLGKAEDQRQVPGVPVPDVVLRRPPLRSKPHERALLVPPLDERLGSGAGSVPDPEPEPGVEAGLGHPPVDVREGRDSARIARESAARLERVDHRCAVRRRRELPPRASA
jgi:hypothetical protein